MADFTSNNDRNDGKKQFSVVKSSSDTQRNWSNYFPNSGVTVYLKYLIDKNLSYIKVGKTLGGDMQDESVQIFSPTTQGTIEAVAYFNEISHNQDKKDNPPPPQEDGENVVSLEDLIKNILEQMMEGDLDFTELEQEMQGTQPPDDGQGGDPYDEEGQNPNGGEPTGEDGQNPTPIDGGNPNPNGGEPTDEDGQNPTPVDGGNPNPFGGQPTDGEDPTNGGNPVNVVTPVGQADPRNIIEALEESFSITGGGLRDIISTKERVMRRINLYNESELQQIANRANMTGSRQEIITQINQALNTIYNG
jgi:hypothetical protein